MRTLTTKQLITLLKNTIEKSGISKVSGLGMKINVKKDITLLIKSIETEATSDEYIYNDSFDALNSTIKTIDILNNISLGNFDEVSDTRYIKTKKANNVFTKTWNKEIKTIKNSVSPKSSTLGKKLKIANQIKVGTVLVDESNSRATFYTVTNVYFTAKGIPKAVDVRYTDNTDSTCIQDYHTVTPGNMRMDDNSLYLNKPITSRGVVIEKIFSGGTYDTVGVPVDTNTEYTSDHLN